MTDLISFADTGEMLAFWASWTSKLVNVLRRYQRKCVADTVRSAIVTVVSMQQPTLVCSQP